MSKKGKYSQKESKGQATLSKFFSSSSSKTKSSKTDKNNLFQVETKDDNNSPKKRSKTQYENESESDKQVSKKAKLKQDDSSSDALTSPSKQKSKNKSGRVSSTNSSHNGSSKVKLQQFDYVEEDDTVTGADNGELTRKEFVSQDCFSIDFTRSSDSDEKQDGCNVEGNEEEENTADTNSASQSNSKAKSVLSQFESSKGKKKQEKVKYTPLEQQFVEIKSQHPDTLLFVECGYKYRFFGDDAEIAAKVLNIMCHMDHNFMTGSIPVHRLFVHVRRLVAAGYKVGVVKQTETAHVKAAGDNKSAPFTRELTSVYTKSTLIGEDVDPMTGSEGSEQDMSTLKCNNYLMCLYEATTDKSNKKREIGIVCVDPAVGDVIYDCFLDGDSFSELEMRIAHLSPVEILIPKNLSPSLDKIVTDIAAINIKDDDRIRIERMNSEDVPSSLGAVDRLTNFYKKDVSNLQTVLNLAKPVTICLSMVIDYLKQFNLESILSLTSNFHKFSFKSKHMHLSAQSLANLEVFHNSSDGSVKGSLFSVMNHTITRFGSRLLRNWISLPLLNTDEICKRLDAIEEINSGQMPDLKKTTEILAKLPDVERGLCSIFYKKSSPLEFYNVTKGLETARKYFSQYRSQAQCQLSSSLLLLVINQIPDLLEGVGDYCNSINESAAKKSDKANLFVDEKQFPAISQRKIEIADVIAEIQEHRKEVRKTVNQPGLDYVTVNQVEFLIQVKNSSLKSVPSSWKNISSTKQVTRFHSPFIANKYKRLNELRELLVADVIKAWQGFLRDFSANFVKYKEAVKCMATLDCLLSLAKTSAQDSFCKPQMTSGKMVLEIEEGRHPILDSLKGECQQIMPNNTNLNADDLRVMVISGPNMGGKSSYIRQVALITIMAQVGCYVPARSARMGIMDGIYTRMGASDKIFQGQSTFMVELQEASEIMSQVTANSLVILDELGRGTSTHDGVAIAHATLKHFITQTQSLVLFVTHFPMMLAFQQIHPKTVQNFHMSFFHNQTDDMEEEDSSRITFLYQLVEGAAHKSYGLNVARLADISSSIIQLAAKKSTELESIIASRIMTYERFLKLWKAESDNILSLVQEVCK